MSVLSDEGSNHIQSVLSCVSSIWYPAMHMIGRCLTNLLGCILSTQDDKEKDRKHSAMDNGEIKGKSSQGMHKE